MQWQTIGRPGYFGKKRDLIFENWNQQYGKDKWRIRWRWDGEIIRFEDACQVYQDAYLQDSFHREELWRSLTDIARDVFDHDESDIKSGLDYTIQKSKATHIQDVAIRNVAHIRGFEFKGNDIIQIRSHKTYWGEQLSPGKVIFHLPSLIVNPREEGWWDINSVEDFYQSNKVLQIKEQKE